FSAGYDRNRHRIIAGNDHRITLRSSNIYKPVKALERRAIIQNVEAANRRSDTPLGYNQMGAGYGNYPYMRLADDDGTPLQVETVGMNPIFRDTVAQGRLLDWTYRPLAEVNSTSNERKVSEHLLKLQATYSILPSLNLSITYNYRRANSLEEVWRGRSEERRVGIESCAWCWS